MIEFWRGWWIGFGIGNLLWICLHILMSVLERKIQTRTAKNGKEEER